METAVEIGVKEIAVFASDLRVLAEESQLFDSGKFEEIRAGYGNCEEE